MYLLRRCRTDGSDDWRVPLGAFRDGGDVLTRDADVAASGCGQRDQASHQNPTRVWNMHVPGTRGRDWLAETSWVTSVRLGGRRDTTMKQTVWRALNLIGKMYGLGRYPYMFSLTCWMACRENRAT